MPPNPLYLPVVDCPEYCIGVLPYHFWVATIHIKETERFNEFVRPCIYVAVQPGSSRNRTKSNARFYDLHVRIGSLSGVKERLKSVRLVRGHSPAMTVFVAFLDVVKLS